MNQWPEQAFPLQDVQSWVASALHLPDPDGVVPVVIYAAYSDPPDQRLTARLAFKDGAGVSQEVVFKGNRLPLLAHSARAYALVSRHGGGSVPHILAWEDDETDGSSRLLYRPFEGRSVGESGEAVLLSATARTMAHIQTAVAVSGEAEAVGLAAVRAGDIPASFDAVVAHIEKNGAVWQTDVDGKLTKSLGFPAAKTLDLLAAKRPQVARAAAEVTALELPTTIDHGDLHGGNAIVQESGVVLIYDWETATVGCPLFSIEKLLVAAWHLDENPAGGGPWGYVSGTPTQALVRDAYLQTLSRTDISVPVFKAAMALATIKEMLAEIEWAKLVGWPDGNPEWTAQLIRRMCQHLQDAG